MARRRRPGSRASIVDDHAELIVPIDVIVDADGTPMRFSDLKRWFQPISIFPADVPGSLPGASVVLDRFAYDLHLSDVGHTSDVHGGDEFHLAARTRHTVDVFVVEGVDPRRSKPEDLAGAAAAGRMIAGIVAAFTVDVLDP